MRCVRPRSAGLPASARPARQHGLRHHGAPHVRSLYRAIGRRHAGRRFRGRRVRGPDQCRAPDPQTFPRPRPFHGEVPAPLGVRSRRRPGAIRFSATTLDGERSTARALRASDNYVVLGALVPHLSGGGPRHRGRARRASRGRPGDRRPRALRHRGHAGVPGRLRARRHAPGR